MGRATFQVNLLSTLCAAALIVALLAGAFEMNTPVRAGFTVLAFFYFWGQIAKLRNVRKMNALLLAVNRIGRDLYDEDSANSAASAQREWADVGMRLDDLQAAVAKVDSRVASSAAKAERSSAQRRLILKSMADGLLAIDLDEHVVLLNRAAVRLLGLPDANHRGRALENITGQTEVLALMRKCLRDGLAGRERVELAYADGESSRILELRAAPLKTEVATKLAGCVLVIEDRTELERLERVRRDFVSNVSHELKTPLTSVRGYLETVLEDPDIEPEIRQRFLEKANNNAERLSAIVGDLISLARAESQEGDALRTPVNLATIVREVAAEATPTAEVKSIHIAVDAEERCTILGDKSALQTALLNLVNNAIHYSPSGTTVRVELTRKVGFAILAVEDDGPGIPVAHQERLFERFYRVDKDRSRDLGGTGLGLSIVRNVAVAHGGSVKVESAIGKGSRFWLELPLQGRVDT